MIFLDLFQPRSFLSYFLPCLMETEGMRVAGWVFGPWPWLTQLRTECSVGQIVILVLLRCPQLQHMCVEGWQG